MKRTCAVTLIKLIERDMVLGHFLSEVAKNISEMAIAGLGCTPYWKAYQL